MAWGHVLKREGKKELQNKIKEKINFKGSDKTIAELCQTFKACTLLVHSLHQPEYSSGRPYGSGWQRSLCAHFTKARHEDGPRYDSRRETEPRRSPTRARTPRSTFCGHEPRELKMKLNHHAGRPMTFLVRMSC